MGKRFHRKLETISIWLKKWWCFLVQHEFSEHSVRASTRWKLVSHPECWISTVHNWEHDELLYWEKGECLLEMKKNLKNKLNVTMINSGKQAGEMTYACCSTCPAGKGPFASCKHLAALCSSGEKVNLVRTDPLFRYRFLQAQRLKQFSEKCWLQR